MATYELPITSPFTESGDDVYAKPLDGDFSGTNWPADSVAAIEVSNTNVYQITLDETKSYAIYLNAHVAVFTADSGTDVITSNAHGLVNGETLRFKGGNLPAGLSQVTLYYVRDATTNTFKVAATAGGAAINLASNGSGSLTFTSPSKRSKSGDGEPIDTVPIRTTASLTAEGEEALVAAIVASALGTNAEAAATQTAPAALRTAVGLESANLAKLVNAVIGKKVVTPVGDGRFDIAVRNAADSATLVTIRHNPVTGDTTIL